MRNFLNILLHKIQKQLNRQITLYWPHTRAHSIKINKLVHARQSVFVIFIQTSGFCKTCSISLLCPPHQTKTLKYKFGSKLGSKWNKRTRSKKRRGTTASIHITSFCGFKIIWQAISEKRSEQGLARKKIHNTITTCLNFVWRVYPIYGFVSVLNFKQFMHT